MGRQKQQVILIMNGKILKQRKKMKETLFIRIKTVTSVSQPFLIFAALSY